MRTIPRQFFETAKNFPKRPALKFKFQGAYITITFEDLKKRVEKLTLSLKNLGLQKGDRLAILSENRTEWVRTDLATLILGAIVVPVHTTLSPKIIKHILLDSGSKIILVSNQEQFNKLILVIDDLPELETIIYINLDHPENYVGNKKLISLDEVMNLPVDENQPIEILCHRDDVASIIYTSGTTAMPKGVMLTHYNLLFDAEAAITAVPVTEKDVLLSFMPLSHVLERTAGYYAPLILRGACIAYAESIKTLTENLKEVRPTILVSVPRVFEKMHTKIWENIKQGSKLKYKLFIWALHQPHGTLAYTIADKLVFSKIKKILGGHFRFTISGGASLNHKLARFFARIGIKIIEGYGLTETSPVVAVNRPDNIKFGTVGQHLVGVALKLNPDKEILVRGPNVMLGYYKNEALTKETIDNDGWLHTGDLGFIDPEGFLTIIGRRKEMISLSNGKIAWPEQLENILEDDRLIAQAIIFGNNKSYLTALIVPDWQEVSRQLDKIAMPTKEPDQLVNDQKIIDFFTDRINKINDQFAEWEKIRKFVLLPKEFSQTKDELTPTLKLRRKTIEQNYQKEITKLYA
ncbi:MAG: long-chain fatty acid--CoA ligase [Candidatus Buchananbacteria bacterium]|nr:long-chain fatty acid--CoA ligase [Candidatus Buchananbacteria bacterium]